MRHGGLPRHTKSVTQCFELKLIIITTVTVINIMSIIGIIVIMLLVFLLWVLLFTFLASHRNAMNFIWAWHHRPCTQNQQKTPSLFESKGLVLDISWYYRTQVLVWRGLHTHLVFHFLCTPVWYIFKACFGDAEPALPILVVCLRHL